MWGQWLGKFNGSNNGEVILNIDKDYETRGKLSIYDQTTETPPRWAEIQFTKNKKKPSATFFYLGDPPQWTSHTLIDTVIV